MEHILSNKYVICIGVAVLTYIALFGLKKLLTYKIAHLHEDRENRWDTILAHTVDRTSQFFLIAAAIYNGLQYLPHKAKWDSYFDRSFFVALMFQTIFWGNFLTDQYVQWKVHRKARYMKGAATSISIIKLVSKFMLFSLIFLFTLHNLDIKITTMLAGFGVGGIAVALAIQKLLGDFISSASIVLDKPFVVGDFIILDANFMGEVEHIGLRTTRIKSLFGEQMIIPNSDILNSRIKNMHRMKERRILHTYALSLETEPETMLEAVETIKRFVNEKYYLRLERCHWARITRDAMEIELTYYYLHDDYNLHMDGQQVLLTEVTRAFRAAGIKFAYPMAERRIINGDTLNRSKDFSRIADSATDERPQ